jgi:DegV family protein with EDD domain
MSTVKVVTDSTADIPADLAEHLDITVVPLNVHFGSEQYLDGVDIQADEFYDKLQSSNELPTTSQPSPATFVDTYKSLSSSTEEEVDIISIHLSAALSGTYQSASLAQNMVEDDANVHVLDSKKASYATGMIAVAVAEAARAGKSMDECLRLAKHCIENCVVYFLVDSLHYLQKGGRIGKASAVLGSVLNIKPILSLDEQGEVYAADRVRGNKKALQRIIHHLRDFADQNPVRMGISHAQAPEEAVRVQKQLQEHFSVQDTVLTTIGPVIGTHVGPQTLAIMMVKAETPSSST